MTDGRLIHEMRTPDGKVVLRDEGAEFIDKRAAARLPDGDYEQYMSLDGGETWRGPLYLTRNYGEWAIKPCTHKVPAGYGFKVHCGLPLGHAGPCA